LQFLPDPARGLTEIHHVLRQGRCAAACVISSPERAPMWGIFARCIESLHSPSSATCCIFHSPSPTRTTWSECGLSRRSGAASSTRRYDW
jgi:hypothetical protein